MTMWQKRIVLARGRRWTWMVLMISNKILRWEGDYCADESEYGFLCLYLREGKSPFRRVDGITDKTVFRFCLARGRQYTLPMTPAVETCDKWHISDIADTWDGSIVSVSVLRRELVSRCIYYFANTTLQLIDDLGRSYHKGSSDL